MIRILSALRMRGLHDKRHLLAKLRICGSENCYEISVQLNGKVNIYVHSLEKIEERRKWGIYTKWGPSSRISGYLIISRAPEGH